MNGKENTQVQPPSSRRDFLRTTGVATAAASLVSAESVLHEVRAASGGPHYGMVIDLRRCFGCHACSAACKAEYRVPLGKWNSWVNSRETGQFPKAARTFLPVLCNHCENPPCVTACPTEPKATFVAADGTVQLTDERCIGCARCERACPYKVRWMLAVPPDPKLDRFKDQVARKCTLCVHRLADGLVPACVNTCNARARIFGDLKDPQSEISQLLAANKAAVLLPDKDTQPKVFYLGLPPDLDYQPTHGGDYARDLASAA